MVSFLVFNAHFGWPRFQNLAYLLITWMGLVPNIETKVMYLGKRVLFWASTSINVIWQITWGCAQYIQEKLSERASQLSGDTFYLISIYNTCQKLTPFLGYITVEPKKVFSQDHYKMLRDFFYVCFFDNILTSNHKGFKRFYIFEFGWYFELLTYNLRVV